MKHTAVNWIVILMVLLPSCSKETIGIKVIKTLTIDKKSHTFINDDGNHCYPNTLLSQQDKHIYELKMTKDVNYRISATQPDTYVNHIQLTLLNSVGDTVAESLNESISKSFIVLKSPQTTSFFLTVSLIKHPNPTLNYRLYFEEIVDELKSFSDYEWYSNGEWKVTGPITAEMKNYDSRVYRHLKLKTPVTDKTNASFIIQSGSADNFSFGFVLDPSGNPLSFSEYAYELPNYGHAFIYLTSESKYAIINIMGGSMSYGWDNFSNANLDFSAGVKVELKSNNIYINGAPLKFITGSINNFMIILEDRGDGTTKVMDFKLF